MMDITSVVGSDIGLFDSQVPKATNILSTQLGSLEYAKDLGIDLKYFLSEDFRFQNASFRAYLVEVLANNGVNVARVLETVDNLSEGLTFQLNPSDNTGSLVAR